MLLSWKYRNTNIGISRKARRRMRFVCLYAPVVALTLRWRGDKAKENVRMFVCVLFLIEGTTGYTLRNILFTVQGRRSRRALLRKIAATLLTFFQN